jgi:hypothetical protein
MDASIDWKRLCNLKGLYYRALDKDVDSLCNAHRITELQTGYINGEQFALLMRNCPTLSHFACECAMFTVTELKTEN